MLWKSSKILFWLRNWEIKNGNWETGKLSLKPGVSWQNQENWQVWKWYSVEVLPSRQYHVRIDGSGWITLRNRHHLWQIFSSIPTLIPTASLNPANDTTASPNPTNDTTLNQTTNHPAVTHNITHAFQQQYEPLTIVNDITTTQPKPTRTSTILKRLVPFNKPGLNK